MDEKNKEIVDLVSAHEAEKKELEKTLEYRDVEMFRLEAALRNVSSEVVARDAKLLALSTYSNAQNQSTKALEEEVTELKTKLVHCEEALSKATTTATEEQIKDAEARATGSATTGKVQAAGSGDA